MGKQRRTTAEQRRMMIELFEEDKYQDRVIADMVGTSPRVVQYHKRINGYTDHEQHRPHGKKWTEEAGEEAARLWRQTRSVEALAEHFGVTEKSLRTQFSLLRSKGIYAPYLYKS